MRTRKFQIVVAVLSFLIVGSFTPLWSQGTAFTYQGQLSVGGDPATGSYDFRFALYETNKTGTALTPDLTNSAVGVTNGLFTTTLDFGADALAGTNLWLDIGVKAHGSTNSFTELSGRQLLTATPFAVTAGSLAGVVENNFVQVGVTNGTIGGGTNNGIASGANISTIAGGQANGVNSNSFASVISGGANNMVGANSDTSTIAGGNENVIQNSAGVSTISGGVLNTISTDSPRSVIAGGSNSTIGSNSQHSVIGGGNANEVGANSIYGTIAGGSANMIGTNSQYSDIGGGSANVIGSDADSSTIAGGANNSVGFDSFYGTVSGGGLNRIGAYSFDAVIAGGYGNSIATNCAAATINGGAANSISTNSQAAVIDGGQANFLANGSLFSLIGGGYNNGIDENSEYSAIVGGAQNVIETNSTESFVGGGAQNAIGTGANFSFIGGGTQNEVGSGVNYGVIGGGYENSIITDAADSLIGGGSENRIESGADSAIGGGANNVIDGSDSVIPGGYANYIQGNGSFAAGHNALAINDGCFVWGDSQLNAFQTTSSNQFLVRASGGVGIDTENPAGASLYVQGGQSGGSFANATVIIENTSTATGSSGSGPALRVVSDAGSEPSGALSVSANGTGPIAEFGNGLQFVASIANNGTINCTSLNQTSDRNAKEHFAPLNTERVLEKVAEMPVTEWNYKTDAAGVKHIGPMAQDFSATFGLNGEDDKHISVVDEGGVALAAIQGLNAKLEAEVQDLHAQNEKLEKRLAEIEAALSRGKN